MWMNFQSKGAFHLEAIETSNRIRFMPGFLMFIIRNKYHQEGEHIVSN